MVVLNACLIIEWVALSQNKNCCLFMVTKQQCCQHLTSNNYAFDWSKMIRT